VEGLARHRAIFDGFTGPYVPDSDIAPIFNPEFFGNTIMVNGRTWPDLKVAVETDGWGTHGRRQGFEDDRARDARLLAQGWRVLRVTYRRLRREPTAVVAELAAVLAQAASASNSSVYGWSVASATGA